MYIFTQPVDIQHLNGYWSLYENMARGKLTKGVWFLSCQRFQCSSPRIISLSSSSFSASPFRFLFPFFPFCPTQVSFFFSDDMFKSMKHPQPSFWLSCYNLVNHITSARQFGDKNQIFLEAMNIQGDVLLVVFYFQNCQKLVQMSAASFYC